MLTHKHNFTLQTNKKSIMKKIISYAASLLITISVAASPGSNIIRSFNETFPNAVNVKWNDDVKGYAVSFMQNGNFTKVLFNKKGDFICSWKYSDGKELPTTLVMTLQKNYNNNKIIGVTEYTADQNMFYEIKLSYNEALYSVKASADGKIISDEKLN